MNALSLERQDAESLSNSSYKKVALPKGWASTALKNLFDFKYGKGLRQELRNETGKVSVFGSNGIVGKHVSAISSGPTIIVGRKGSVGEVHFCEYACWPIDTTYFIDRFLCDLPPVYWKYFLTSLQLGDQEKSSAIPGISRDDIYPIVVPVPPLEEQRRIVAKLEMLLAKVSSSQKRLSRIPILLKRFRQSVLAAACSGKLTADWREENHAVSADCFPELDIHEVPAEFPSLPESWKWSMLESVCSNVVDCPHSTPKWANSGKLCIRTTNFRPGILDLSEVRYVSVATFNERIERLRPEAGDIVYSREGGILGIACQIPPGVELCLGQRMMLFRVKSGFQAELLMSWLNSPVITRRVQELTGGSAAPHLNVRDIRAFPTPVPPSVEQQEIMRRVKALFAFANQIETRLTLAQSHIDRLTQSILAKAFRGELVPTEHDLAAKEGREYEPASKLLERIRAESDKEVPSRTKRPIKRSK